MVRTEIGTEGGEGDKEKGDGESSGEEIRRSWE